MASNRSTVFLVLVATLISAKSADAKMVFEFLNDFCSVYYDNTFLLPSLQRFAVDVECITKGKAGVLISNLTPQVKDALTQVQRKLTAPTRRLDLTVWIGTPTRTFKEIDIEAVCATSGRVNQFTLSADLVSPLRRDSYACHSDINYWLEYGVVDPCVSTPLNGKIDFRISNYIRYTAPRPAAFPQIAQVTILEDCVY